MLFASCSEGHVSTTRVLASKRPFGFAMADKEYFSAHGFHNEVSPLPQYVFGL